MSRPTAPVCQTPSHQIQVNPRAATSSMNASGTSSSVAARLSATPRSCRKTRVFTW